MSDYKCDFCRDLKQLRDIDSRSNPDTVHQYTLILLRRAWNRQLGSGHAGEKQYRAKAVGYSLIYCPECGRRIQDDEQR